MKSLWRRGNDTRSAEQGSKRSGPVRLNSPLTAAAAAADIQGAVVEKGIEVMGKMVDKQLQIIDEAQEKAEKFLKKDVRLLLLDTLLDLVSNEMTSIFWKLSVLVGWS